MLAARGKDAALDADDDEMTSERQLRLRLTASSAMLWACSNRSLPSVNPTFWFLGLQLWLQILSSDGPTAVRDHRSVVPCSFMLAIGRLY